MSKPERRGGLLWIGSLVFGSGGLWTIVERAGDVDFLMGLSPKSPVVRWLASNADLCLMTLGAVLLALNYYAHSWFGGMSDRLATWRWRRRMRGWTDAGLNWMVRRESHKLLKDGRMAAILSITPVPGIELPQPLDVIITCVGHIGEVSSRFYHNEDEVGKTDWSGDVVISAPNGRTATLRLCSPKLLPPARWDVTITSAGNAEVKVVEVKRSPRRGSAP